MLGFHKPMVTCVAHDGARYAKYAISPLERGFGATLGNSLRRVLLSFVSGAAITEVKIEGVRHEFSTIPGVYEDVMEITLNLKEVAIKVDEQVYPDPEEPITVRLEASGKGRVLAADLRVPAGVTVVNPEHYLCSITEEEGSIAMEMVVRRGRGYAPVEQKPHQDSRPIGTIPIDAIFTPTRKVSFVVEPCRMGERTDLDRLVLEVWTSGTVRPDEAITSAATWLDAYLRSLFELPTEVVEEIEEKPGEREEGAELLERKITAMEFSTRTLNCLRRERIDTLGELVQKTEAELLAIKNFGQKSLGEVIEKLAKLGLALRQPAE
jgi:DNA-directed RNA polymerase subunit alpha